MKSANKAPAKNTRVKTKKNVVPKKKGREKKRPLGALRYLLVVLAMLCIGGGSLVGGAYVAKQVVESRYFRIERVLVWGARRASVAPVLRSQGIERGRAIFRVDEDRVLRALRKHPWVRDAALRRMLPRRYDIEVKEWKPIAMLRAPSGKEYLVSDDGVLFKERGPRDRGRWPLIHIPHLKELPVQALHRQRIVAQAVDFLQSFRSFAWSRHGITRAGRAPRVLEVQVDGDGYFTLTLGPGPLVVRFVDDRRKQRFRKLASILIAARRRGMQPETVFLDDLRRTERVTVQVATR